MVTKPQDLLAQNNYTDSGWESVQGAPIYAAKNGRSIIEVVDLLNVALERENNLLQRVLLNLNKDYQNFCSEIKSIASLIPSTGNTSGSVTMSADVFGALARARDIAGERNVVAVDNDHIILGLVGQILGAKEGYKTSIKELLLSFGVNLDLLEKELLLPTRNYQADETLKTELLSKYGENLTEQAKANKLDPVVGRDIEVERVLRVLTRRTKNNAVLVGDAGVGKTAIVEGIAQRMVKDGVPSVLRDKQLFSLQMSSLVAGTSLRGQFEERLQKVIKEVSDSRGQILLFIDEIHLVIGAGAVGEGAMDAANIMKPALARGELQVVGATTPSEYRKHIEKDEALARRFSPVFVEQPSQETTLEMLEILKPRYEAHHNVVIDESAIQAAVKLSARYITDRFLPDKAIDLIDEASAKLRLQIDTMYEDTEISRLREEITKLREEEQVIYEKQEYEKHASIKTKRLSYEQKLLDLQKRWQEKNLTKSGQNVTEDDIASVISERTGIPLKRLVESDIKRLSSLEENLHRRIVGQNHAVSAIANAIRRAQTGLKDIKRPIGSFMFAGPTGVGKTELARALAELLFDDENNMVKIDMSEYQERHSISRLIGSPPGYVGYDDAGQLTERIRRRPFSVVLFDEIEKAHPDIFDALLQVLDDGRLTDNHGRTVDFSNTVVILTSNIGTAKIKQSVFGFEGSGEADFELKRLNDTVLEEIKGYFRPEFINRLDEILVFNPLNENEILQIVDKVLLKTVQNVAEHGIELEVLGEAKKWLAKRGYDANYGARPLRRLVQRTLENKLAELMVCKKDYKRLIASIKDDELVVKKG